MTAPGRLILFDGICNLCSVIVQWVIRRDPKARFHFASLQSEAGRSAVIGMGESPDHLPDSVVFIDDDGLHTRSTAVLRIMKA